MTVLDYSFPPLTLSLLQNKYSEEANAVDAGTAQVKVCDEQDIFAEGNSFDLSAADVSVQLNNNNTCREKII